jgi:acyl carrier protein
MSSHNEEKDVLNVVAAAISEALMIDREKIGPNANLFDDLGAESIDILDIRFRIEDAFKIKIAANELAGGVNSKLTADQIRRLMTVENVVAYVAARINSPERPS